MPPQCLTLPLWLLGRYTEIERENRILLEKMSNIMQSNKPNLYNPSKCSWTSNSSAMNRLNDLWLVVCSAQWQEKFEYRQPQVSHDEDPGREPGHPEEAVGQEAHL